MPVLRSEAATFAAFATLVIFLVLGNSVAPDVIGSGAAFLLLATYFDLTSLRIPNGLTLPALLVAIGVGAWSGGGVVPRTTVR